MLRSCLATCNTVWAEICSLHLLRRSQQLQLGLILLVVVKFAPTKRHVRHVQTTAAANNNEQTLKRNTCTLI